MFDHVTLRVSDLERSRRLYGAALGALGYPETATDGDFFEWGDLSISRACADRPVTRAAHVAVAATSAGAVDGFWGAATGAGFRDDGSPAARPCYDDEYYGAFVRDLDGNSVEAVHHGQPPRGMIDHVFIGVRDLNAARRFYRHVLAAVGHGFWASGSEPDGDEWVAFGARGGSVWLVERAPTANLHIAFAAGDNATVDEFHRRALAAGYRDNGAPGEREYHAGYYGAFVLDPDGNNVEAVCHNRG